MSRQVSVTAILEKYCAALPEELSRLVYLVNAQKFSSTHPKEIARNLQGETHRMAGAAQCMGYRELGRELGRIEDRLSKSLRKGGHNLDEVFEATMNRLITINSMIENITPENSRLIMKNMLQDDPESAETFTHPLLQELRAQKILLADDDLYVQDIIASYLTDMGIEDVMTVSSGLEVINTIRDFQPDIIITDWEMKPISGLELLQYVRNGGTHLDAHTPILFLTSNRDNRSQMQISTNGANRHLTKPISPFVLRSALLEILENRAQITH